MRIGLDVDGILYNWEAHARRLLRYEFGISLPESSHWDFIKDSINREQWEWLWTVSVVDLFQFGYMYPEADLATNILRNLGEVCIITNIPRNIIPVRLQWLIRNNIWFDEFRVAHNFNKPEILPLCDIYIDDCLTVAECVLYNTDKEMIIWDRPWNQNFVGSRAYHRVSTWEEVIKIVGEIQ